MSKSNVIFTPETFRFFRELAGNNRKQWMDANRERYREHVVEPFRHLLEELAPAALKLNPEFHTGGRTGTNFSRINRDIRFAADKSPYRPQMYLMFSDRRATEGDDGQLYVGLFPDAVTVGFRIYGGRRTSRLTALAAPRAMAHPQWLAGQKRRLGRGFESYWYATEKGEWTKHSGWPARPEDWKRIKGWIVRRKMATSAALRPDFVRNVSAVFKQLFPLHPFTSAARWSP